MEKICNILISFRPAFFPPDICKVGQNDTKINVRAIIIDPGFKSHTSTLTAYLVKFSQSNTSPEKVNKHVIQDFREVVQSHPSL